MKTLKEFLLIAEYVTKDSTEYLLEAKKPLYLGGKACPKDLGGLTFGQLVKLQDIRSIEEMLILPATTVMEIPLPRLLSEPVDKVTGFSMWCAKEVEKIAGLFALASSKPAPEEIQAGINRLKFGTFGLIDWFAIRMGIQDHEDVMDIPWVRIYRCLDMDSQKLEYEKRLRKIYKSQ